MCYQFEFWCTEQNTLSSFFPQKVQYSNVKNTVIFKKGPSKRGFSMAVRTFKKRPFLGENPRIYALGPNRGML